MGRRAVGTILTLMLALAGFGALATAADQPAIELDCGSGVKMKLVLIPAGEFMMGGEEPPEEVARKCIGGRPGAVYVGESLGHNTIISRPVGTPAAR